MISRCSKRIVSSLVWAGREGNQGPLLLDGGKNSMENFLLLAARAFSPRLLEMGS